MVTEVNLFVAEVCHIEAANPGGARYNPFSRNEDRRSYNNLMILCHAHHRRIDFDLKTYTVERLSQMKAEHELQVRDQVFEANASVVAQVQRSSGVVLDCSSETPKGASSTGVRGRRNKTYSNGG